MGFTQKFYQAPLAFSFKDVILLPGFSKVEPNEIDISTNFSKNIPIKVPLVSSPMDTVTEEKMAIALALNGGMGIIHRNCSKEEELEMVKKVKEAEFSKEKYK
ncbi:MAG: IMP dehydrogenase, partial [Candidatus Micrarchaeia archaeon]